MIAIKQLIAIGFTYTLPMLLIKYYSSRDNEIGNKISPERKDIIKLIIVTLGYTLYTYMISDIITMNHYISISLLTGYLIFMSYTDQKTGLVYSIVSIAMILIESTQLILKLNTIKFGYQTVVIGIILIGLVILSLLGKLGSGDVLIYIVIFEYYIANSEFPMFFVVGSMIISNVLFILSNLASIIKKDAKRNQPFTLYITIGTFVCNIFPI